ncbi:hypothetical protein [Nocardia otitidiscaviarum]|uniref:hypothetical protein n=1 Tax=Nocardia otitidiscaviarum TaxID=1823 RepID=UPI00313AE47D
MDNPAEFIDWPTRVPTQHIPPQSNENADALAEAVIDHPALRIDDHSSAEDLKDHRALESEICGCRTLLTHSAQRYSELVQVLPPVIAAARTAHWCTPESSTADQLIEAYHIARHFFSATGDSWRAATVADRAMSIAVHQRQPLLTAASAWHVAISLLRTQYPKKGHDYALAAARRIAEAEIGELEVATLTNALRLVAARAAATAGAFDESEQLLAALMNSCDAMNLDRYCRGVGFGPTEVAITRMEIAIERHDADLTISIAECNCNPDHLPIERQVAYYICQARAYAQRRDDVEATIALLRVATLSPEDITYDSNARECVQYLVRRNNYLTRSEVGRLASIAGISS